MKVDAELVLKLRGERGWSQEELAQVSGLNLRTIQRVEKTAAASLRSKKALALAFDLDIQDLDDKEQQMSPCPECRSNEVYQYDGLIDSSTIGGELLPKLSSGRLSSAKMRAVVCGDCGYLRYFVDEKARQNLRSSPRWSHV